MQKLLIPLIMFLIGSLCFSISLSNGVMNISIFINAIFVVILSIVVIIKDKRKGMRAIYSLIVLFVLLLMAKSFLKMV